MAASHPDRKALVREYKETPRLAGVYRVRRTATGKSLVGASLDIPGILNRQRFQLKSGMHPDRELQREWNEFGAEAFVFETLDPLEPKKEPDADPTADLRILKEMWIEKLSAAGVPLYSYSRRGT